MALEAPSSTATPDRRGLALAITTNTPDSDHDDHHKVVAPAISARAAAQSGRNPSSAAESTDTDCMRQPS